MKLGRGAFGITLPRGAHFERFLKRRYVRAGHNRLHRKRIFILPTYHGLVFALTLFVMLLGALNYNNSLAFMLTFLLGGVGLISTFHTYRNINQLSIRPAKSLPTFVGEPATFAVIVDNYDGPPRYAVSLTVADQPPVTIDINADHTSVAHLSVPTQKRGRLALEILTVHTRFPLGLYRAWSYAQVEATCLVYPRPADIYATRLPEHHVGGEKSTTMRGTEDFLGFRSYALGDSTKHIYWKGVARGQPLLTKQFSRPQTQELWLNWDDVPGDTESRLSQLCRWVLDAHHEHCTYGLRLPDNTIAPASGDTHKHRCLEALALFEIDR